MNGSLGDSDVKEVRVHKYHGNGNDYIISDPNKSSEQFLCQKSVAIHICERNYGCGSDGLIVGPLPVNTNSQYTNNILSKNPICRIRLINPDGTEFEKSGNGYVIILC